MDMTVILGAILSGALGVIGFFLKGIYASVKGMAESIKNLNDRLIKHETGTGHLERRLEKMETKLERYEELFYMNYEDLAVILKNLKIK